MYYGKIKLVVYFFINNRDLRPQLKLINTVRTVELLFMSYYYIWGKEGRGMGSKAFHKIIKINYYSIWKRNSLKGGKERKKKKKKIHALIVFTKTNNLEWLVASVCAIISLLPLCGEAVLPLGRLRARYFRGGEWGNDKGASPESISYNEQVIRSRHCHIT